MESSGECRGCQRNIKFAVKQARLCRTCYNKTYLTSQKRREYYKNKKKRREIHTTTSPSVEPAIDVHQHRPVKSRPVKKEHDPACHRSPPHHHQPDNQGPDPVAAHLYLLSYHQSSHLHTPSCSDCVPRGGSLFGPSSPGALSLAALAHASQHHAASASSSPASPSSASSLGSSSHHLSSATCSSMPSSPSSSPPLSVLPYQQLQLQYQQQAAQNAGPAASPVGASLPPTASASSSTTASPYGSPATATTLLHDLLQQVSAFPAYYAALAPALGLVPAMPTEMFASTTASFSTTSSAADHHSQPLPSLSSFLLPKGSMNPLAIPTPRYPSTHPVKATGLRYCAQCGHAAHQPVDTDSSHHWLCASCLATHQQRDAPAATRSPAIKNLLN